MIKIIILSLNKFIHLIIRDRERVFNMKNKLFYTILVGVFIAVISLVGCQSNDETNGEENTEDTIFIATSFTLIEDIVKQIGGDLVETHNLVPIGTDPHEYEPLPEDTKAVTDADGIIYNGFNLEGGDHGWLAKMVESVGKDEAVMYELMEGADPLYLSDEDGEAHEINPHTFLDPVLGLHMAENTLKALIDIAPEHEEVFEENAQSYFEELQAIDEEYEQKINEIPEENRLLVTSERAYQYMAKRYGLEEGFIWEIDTEEQGTPEQITSLIELVNEKQPPVLFVESNVDRRAMETVAQETGVEIFTTLYSDEIGKPGEEGDTYLKFLQYNIEQIYAGLTQ